MSVAALLFINGWVHILASIRTKGYVPGVITGLALYLPLSIYAYYLFIGSGQLALNQVFISVILGLLYQTIPLGYFAIASAVRRA
jgi:hypothetical protein